MHVKEDPAIQLISNGDAQLLGDFGTIRKYDSENHNGFPAVLTDSAGDRVHLSNGHITTNGKAHAVQANGTHKSLIISKQPSQIRRGQPKCEETFEESSMLIALLTYLSYAFIVVIGYIKELLVNPGISREYNREGYVPLYNSFESFYARNVYRRLRDCYTHVITTVPGAEIGLRTIYSEDCGWTMKVKNEISRCLNLGSYNYLGFAENNGQCAKDASKIVEEYGTSVCTSRQELGTMSLHLELESMVAKFLGVEDAVVFGMGFATNSLNLPSLLGPGCLVMSDELNHASIILGLRLSGASICVFKHNDVKDLERKLRRAIANGQNRSHRPWRKILIVVEGVYSMEGTVVKLPQLIELKKKYKAYLYLDEAHSVGAMGPNGRGVIDYYGCDPNDVDILMGTFTKSFGSAGGYLAGKKDLIDYLRINSHAQCYASSMSPPVAQQIITVIQIICGEKCQGEGLRRIRQLARNTRYFRKRLKQMGFIIYGNNDSPVIPLLLYMPSKIGAIVRELKKRGIASVGVGFPATPILAGRARFCMSASHTQEMLDKALKEIDDVGDVVGLKYSRMPQDTKEILYYDPDDEFEES